MPPYRLIDYLPSLFQGEIQDYSCFIRYSSKDDASPSGCALGFCRSAFSRLAWSGQDRPASDVILAQHVDRWR